MRIWKLIHKEMTHIVLIQRKKLHCNTWKVILILGNDTYDLDFFD